MRCLAFFLSAMGISSVFAASSEYDPTNLPTEKNVENATCTEMGLSKDATFFPFWYGSYDFGDVFINTMCNAHVDPGYYVHDCAKSGPLKKWRHGNREGGTIVRDQCDSDACRKADWVMNNVSGTGDMGEIVEKCQNYIKNFQDKFKNSEYLSQPMVFMKKCMGGFLNCNGEQMGAFCVGPNYMLRYFIKGGTLDSLNSNMQVLKNAAKNQKTKFHFGPRTNTGAYRCVSEDSETLPTNYNFNKVKSSKFTNYLNEQRSEWYQWEEPVKKDGDWETPPAFASPTTDYELAMHNALIRICGDEKTYHLCSEQVRGMKKMNENYKFFPYWWVGKNQAEGYLAYVRKDLTLENIRDKYLNEDKLGPLWGAMSQMYYQEIIKHGNRILGAKAQTSFLNAGEL